MNSRLRNLLGLVVGAAALVLIGRELWVSDHPPDEIAAAQSPLSSFLSAQEKQTRTYLALGFVTFVQLHELGHALIQVLDLPTVGPEEDVVDEFAAVVLVSFDAGSGFGTDFTMAGAAGFFEMWRESEQSQQASGLAFSDEHSLSIQRFYKIACLLVGAYPDRAAVTAQQLGLPPELSERCLVEAPGKLRSWARILAPHLRGTDLARGNLGHRITVTYEPSQMWGGPIDQTMRNGAVFESFPSFLSAQIVIPYPISVRFQDCGVENAFWDPERNQVTICYELVRRALNSFSAGVAVPGN